VSGCPSRAYPPGDDSAPSSFAVQTGRTWCGGIESAAVVIVLVPSLHTGAVSCAMARRALALCLSCSARVLMRSDPLLLWLGPSRGVGWRQQRRAVCLTPRRCGCLTFGAAGLAGLAGRPLLLLPYILVRLRPGAGMHRIDWETHLDRIPTHTIIIHTENAYMIAACRSSCSPASPRRK
jgi:hypothetical protein